MVRQSRIKNFESYIIYDNGKIYSKQSKKFLVTKPNSRGYAQVTLCHNRIRKNFFIHRLVAETFIINIENKSQINHKDGNKLNNNVNNLEWCTHSENQLHSYRILGKKPNKGQLGRTGKLCAHSRAVEQLNLDGSLIKVWDSIKDAATSLNMSWGSIWRVLNGQRKTLKKQLWRYKNANE